MSDPAADLGPDGLPLPVAVRASSSDHESTVMCRGHEAREHHLFMVDDSRVVRLMWPGSLVGEVSPGAIAGACTRRCPARVHQRSSERGIAIGEDLYDAPGVVHGRDTEVAPVRTRSAAATPYSATTWTAMTGSSAPGRVGAPPWAVGLGRGVKGAEQSGRRRWLMMCSF
jgi:hypothetical protein